MQHQGVCHVMNAEEKFSKEMQRAALAKVNEKKGSFTAGHEKAPVVWVEEQTSPMWNRALTLQFCDGREVRTLQKPSLRLAEVGSRGLRNKAAITAWKGEGSRAGGGADLAPRLDKAGCSERQILNVGRAGFHSRRGKLSAGFKTSELRRPG